MVSGLDYRTDLRMVSRDDVLDVVDAALQLHPGLAAYNSGEYHHDHFQVERWRNVWGRRKA